MTFSLEELISANDNGSLEGLLLGYGMLPLDVLKSILEEVEPTLAYYKWEVDRLENLYD